VRHKVRFRCYILLYYIRLEGFRQLSSHRIYYRYIPFLGHLCSDWLGGTCLERPRFFSSSVRVKLIRVFDRTRLRRRCLFLTDARYTPTVYNIMCGSVRVRTLRHMTCVYNTCSPPLTYPSCRQPFFRMIDNKRSRVQNSFENTNSAASTPPSHPHPHESVERARAFNYFIDFLFLSPDIFPSPSPRPCSALYIRHIILYSKLQYYI